MQENTLSCWEKDVFFVINDNSVVRDVDRSAALDGLYLTVSTTIVFIGPPRFPYSWNALEWARNRLRHYFSQRCIARTLQGFVRHLIHRWWLLFFQSPFRLTLMNTKKPYSWKYSITLVVLVPLCIVPLLAARHRHLRQLHTSHLYCAPSWPSKSITSIGTWSQSRFSWLSTRLPNVLCSTPTLTFVGKHVYSVLLSDSFTFGKSGKWVYPWVQSHIWFSPLLARREVLMPSPLHGIMRFLIKGDKKVNHALQESIDYLVTACLIVTLFIMVLLCTILLVIQVCSPVVLIEMVALHYLFE